MMESAMPELKLTQEQLKHIFMGSDELPGVFEQALGFRASTEKYRSTHLMNDLLQSTLGGRPAHRGDHLCRVIREDKTDKGEDNRDPTLRADPKMGEGYAQAFPPGLGLRQISRLRDAAGLLLNFDNGMFKQGQGMISAVATHWTLLGAEGFRRFGIGRYLQQIIGPTGRERLRALLQSDRDPVSQALAPLLWEEDLDPDPDKPAHTLTPFDQDLGRRLTILLQQPLSKPILLRQVAQASTLGVVLKILGAGRPGGRPSVLVLPVETGPGKRPLREESVQALRRSMEALDHQLGELVSTHPMAQSLWSRESSSRAAFLTVSAESLEAAAPEVVARMSLASSDKKNGLWTPARFMLALGRGGGFIQPPSDRAGWGKYMVLPADLLEALILMYVPPGTPARPWQHIWRDISAELGLIIGASVDHDARALREAGVLHISYEHLNNNSQTLLSTAIQQGVARRLPDSGAEAGGELL